MIFCTAVTLLYKYGAVASRIPSAAGKCLCPPSAQTSMCASADHPQSTLQPGQAVTVLNDRVKIIGKINSDIADWLQVQKRLAIMAVGAHSQTGATTNRRALRSRIEEACKQETTRCGFGTRVQSIILLQLVMLTSASIFQTPWQSIVSSTESLAASHNMLAQKIEVDVERPLREFPTHSREMQSISTVQGNLAAMAKELDGAQKKVDKLRDKGGKASAGKVASASSDVETANQQWESQAPFIFERLQALDESRLNHLRDVLTQFQTHEIDQVERNRLSAENCLNVLLNVETADEIKTFALRASGERPGAAPKQKTRGNTGGTLSPPTTTGAADDGASERSGTSGGGGRPGSGRIILVMY